MSSRSVFSLLLALCVAVYLAFSNISIKSEASVIPSPHTLSVQESLAVYGSSIPATLYFQGNMIDTTFEYWGTQDVAEIKSGADLPLSVGTTCLVYVCTQQATATPDYVTVQLDPAYSVFDTTALHATACLISTQSVSSSAYSSPSWKWWLQGYGDYIADNTFSDANSDRRCVKFIQGSAQQWCTAVSIDYHSNSTFSANSQRVSFYGNTPTNYSDSRYRLYLSPLAVSTDGDAQSGTVTTATSSGESTGTQTGGGSSTDLTETNGLIGRVIQAIQGLLDGIAGLFIPDDEFIEDYKDDLQTLLQDHLGGVYEAFEEIADFLETLLTVTPRTTMGVPTLSIPLLGGQSFNTGNWTVSFFQDGSGFELLYDGIKLAFDFLFTAAFLMMLKKKLYVFLAPDSEVITE